MGRSCAAAPVAALALLLALTPPGAAALAGCHVVTGASGYLGRAVVRALLSAAAADGTGGAGDGRVVCLVRPSRVAAERDHWRREAAGVDAAAAAARVEVRPYDMLDGGASLGAVLEELLATPAGRDRSTPLCVYHVASVFGPTADQVQSARDNLKGTVDLVEALARAMGGHELLDASACRLVVTSSMAAVRATGQVPGNGRHYTAADWNTESRLLDASHGPGSWGSCYQWSKTESERQAWELCRRHGIAMASICPSFVFGPPDASPAGADSGSDTGGSYSVELVRQWLHGESPVQSRLFVDVRDVAAAHVLAAQKLPVTGSRRWIVSQETRVPSEEIAAWLRAVCQSAGATLDPLRIYADVNFQGGAIAIGEKEVEAIDDLRVFLGLTLRPVQETIMEMATLLLKQGKLNELQDQI